MVSETLKNAQGIYDMCAEQESRLVFEHFSKEDALRLGLIINEKSKKYGQGVAIRITVNGVEIFGYCQEGATKSNIDWGMRKQRVVELEEVSSLRYRVWMELNDSNWQDRKLDPNLYAEHGGGFPIRVNGVGMIGTVTVSGLPQLDDHQLIVDSISEFLGLE
jgi:uncharacterized protein (UPF0303 family)